MKLLNRRHRLVKVFKYYDKINFYTGLTNWEGRNIETLTTEMFKQSLIYKTFTAMSEQYKYKVDSISLFNSCFGDKKIVPIFSCYFSLDENK